VLKSTATKTKSLTSEFFMPEYYYYCQALWRDLLQSCENISSTLARRLS